MQTVIKIIITLFCMNLMLYFGLNYQAMVTGNPDDIGWSPTYDIIDVFMQQHPTTINASAGNIAFNNSIVGVPSTAVGAEVSESGGIGYYLDELAIVFAIITTLFSVMTAGLGLFFVSGLPPFFAWMIGVPVLIIYVLSLMALIRGVSD